MEKLVLATPLVEWGFAAQALPGEQSCGDMHVFKPFAHGALMAAADGVGHGEEAASAARIASSILEAHADEPVIAIVQRAHESLRGTRGVVMSIASLNLLHGMMTWIGVGNVIGVLLRSEPERAFEEDSLLLRAGVIGARLPPLQAAVLPVSAGDTLILATDGIDSNFERRVARNYPPQKAAETILAQHRRPTDDALVIVARCLGNRP